MSAIGAVAVLLGLVGLVVVVIAGVVGFVVVRRSLRPLDQMAVTAHRIAEGDFDYDPQIPPGDEISDLAKDLGVKLQHVDSSFPTLVDDLKADRCDVAMFAVGLLPLPTEVYDDQVKLAG